MMRSVSGVLNNILSIIIIIIAPRLFGVGMMWSVSGVLNNILSIIIIIMKPGLFWSWYDGDCGVDLVG